MEFPLFENKSWNPPHRIDEYFLKNIFLVYGLADELRPQENTPKLFLANDRMTNSLKKINVVQTDEPHRKRVYTYIVFY